MRILIGGSGSTGSSLLKNILSRHPKMFSGSETSLFSKKELYDDFTRNKKRILKRFPFGLKSHSYHMYNGVDLLHKEYQHSYNSIQALIDKAKDFQSFTDNYFYKGLKGNNKEYWLEKTPSNAFLLKEFLDNFNDSHVIQVARNPYDTISSLLNRGFNIIYSCGIYLLNSSAGLRASNHPNFYLIKYEDLVTNPEKCIKTLCKGLGIIFYPSMLDPGNNYNIKDTKISSWAFDETEKIIKREKSSFERLENAQKHQIISAMKKISVSDSGMKYFDLYINSFQELCDTLNYTWNEGDIYEEHALNINKLLLKDRYNRIIKFYPTGIWYPLTIN